MKRGKNIRGISPIISTVLLIMIVIILAIIILLWSKGFIEETVLKDIAGNEKLAKKFCSDVKLTRILEGNNFGITNAGNVPIYKIHLKTTAGGSSKITEFAPAEGGLVNPGFATMLGSDYYAHEEVKVIPVLLGKSAKSGGATEVTCPEENGFII